MNVITKCDSEIDYEQKLSHLSRTNEPLFQGMHISVNAQTFGYANSILSAAADGESIFRSIVWWKEHLCRIVHVISIILPLHFWRDVPLISLEYVCVTFQ